MSKVRSNRLIDAPRATVGAALRHTRTAETSLTAAGIAGRGHDCGELVVPGDELTFQIKRVPIFQRTRIVRADSNAVTSVAVRGPLSRLAHETVLTDSGRATEITDVLSWTVVGGRLGRVTDVLLRRFFRRAIEERLDAVRDLAQQWANRPVVVGAAISRAGKILAQQRHFPADHAGRWELPGGRVDPGESENAAVVRECQEELGVTVVPTGRVGTDVPLSNGMLLRIYAAQLSHPDAEPAALEHRALRWIGASDLATLDWLEADRALVHSVHDLLR